MKFESADSNFFSQYYSARENLDSSLGLENLINKKKTEEEGNINSYLNTITQCDSKFKPLNIINSNNSNLNQKIDLNCNKNSSNLIEDFENYISTQININNNNNNNNNNDNNDNNDNNNNNAYIKRVKFNSCIGNKVNIYNNYKVNVDKIKSFDNNIDNDNNSKINKDKVIKNNFNSNKKNNMNSNINLNSNYLVYKISKKKFSSQLNPKIKDYKKFIDLMQQKKNKDKENKNENVKINDNINKNKEKEKNKGN
jgi:hypothetical protein